MIDRLIAELEDCLGRVDDTGQKLAGAYLSSAIDVLKASIGQDCPLTGLAPTRAEVKPDSQSNVFRFN